MKKSLFLCMLLFGTLAWAPGPGALKEITVPTDQWHSLPALIHVPQGGPKEKFPLIVAFHGRSIAGQIREGRKIQAVNKADGKLYKFVVLAPLAESWGVNPSQLEVILNDVLKKYPIDSSRIYLTGYSAGGWCTTMSITDNKHLCSRIAAAVPMSPAPMDPVNYTRFKNTTDANIHAWYFAGTGEPQFLENSQRCIDSTNNHKTGMVKLTKHDKGHTGWHEFYDPAYRDSTDNLSIYEWMLQYKRKK
jgi:predicted peptidase